MDALSCVLAAFRLGDICFHCLLALEAAMARLLSFLTEDIWGLQTATFYQVAEQPAVS
jgi:hypothetical protein